MTRINIIPVCELKDQHLIAEYREITMVPAALNRTLRSKVGLRKEKISEKYYCQTNEFEITGIEWNGSQIWG